MKLRPHEIGINEKSAYLVFRCICVRPSVRPSITLSNEPKKRFLNGLVVSNDVFCFYLNLNPAFVSDKFDNQRDIRLSEYVDLKKNNQLRKEKLEVIRPRPV